MYMYVHFESHILCCSRVMSMFTNIPRPAELVLSKVSSIKKGCNACQWLDNVDMHTYAQMDQNKLCGSRVMKNFTS